MEPALFADMPWGGIGLFDLPATNGEKGGREADRLEDVGGVCEMKPVPNGDAAWRGRLLVLCRDNTEAE